VGDPVFVGEGGGGSGATGVTSAGSTTEATASTAASPPASTSTGSSTCGNWTVDPGEACEDGNAAAGDGCSPLCALEAACGNAIVEPGELCDGVAGCDAMCAPDATSDCFGASAYALGTTTVTGGASLDAYQGTESCAQTVRALGYVDIGPLPMRLAVKVVQTNSDVLLRAGCTGAVLGACNPTAVTALLPPHSIVWVGTTMGSVGETRDIGIRLARYGTYFDFDDDGGLMSSGWVYDDSNTLWYVSMPGTSTLVSPPIDLSGVTAVVAHFHHTLTLVTDAVASVEYTVDGQTWLPAQAFTANATFAEVEVPLAGAGGQPAVQVRLVMVDPGGASWILHNLLVGPAST
jgi:cysteine-rich repeat protein